MKVYPQFNLQTNLNLFLGPYINQFPYSFPLSIYNWFSTSSSTKKESKEPEPQEPEPQEREPAARLFEMEYINVAWGYQHYGFYIDVNGIMWEYGNFTGQSIFQEVLNEVFVKIIEPEVLEEMKGYIEPASKGSYSEMVCRGADQGSRSYYCYHNGEKIVLLQTGDCFYMNKSESASILAAWLQSI